MVRPWIRALILAFILASLFGCRSAVPNRDPVGEAFPQVTGTSLAGEAVTLPDARSGEPLLLLVGYVQDAQFDLDRWLLGLMQVDSSVARLEVPTLPGLMPGMAAGWIDDGMRSGIPREDWASVVTLYDEADPVLALTGNESPRNGRVLLLDAEGRVAWFHDRGFSAGKLMELDAAARALGAE
jgi:hypothetical protein